MKKKYIIKGVLNSSVLSLNSYGTYSLIPTSDIYSDADKIKFFDSKEEAEKFQKEFVNYLEKNISNNINLKFVGHNKQSVLIGEEYLKILANSKICINHNRDFTLKYEWYTSDRLFHILGNGSFALSTKIINGEDFFEDKLEYYESYDELVSKVNYFMNNEKERIEKSMWLRKRVHDLFNSKRVAKYILSLVNNDIKDLKTYEWYR